MSPSCTSRSAGSAEPEPEGVVSVVVSVSVTCRPQVSLVRRESCAGWCSGERGLPRVLPPAALAVLVLATAGRAAGAGAVRLLGAHAPGVGGGCRRGGRGGGRRGVHRGCVLRRVLAGLPVLQVG